LYLAIDTSTALVGLALIDDGNVIAEDTWRCVKNHSVELLPHVSLLFQRAGCKIKDVTGLITACGPGGFNGLRVGIGTAKGLAFGLGVPIAGIKTLSAAAYQHAGRNLPVCAILPAGRSEVAWAIYREIDGKWLNVVPDTISLPVDISPNINSATVFAGEIEEALQGELRTQLGDFLVIDNNAPKTRVHALAELGSDRLDNGDVDEVAALQPFYLRRPPITQPKSRSSGARQFAPAVIWDMDGVIVDSGRLHMRAWQEIFVKMGVNYTETDFRNTFGKVNKDIISYKLKGKLTEGFLRTTGQEKEERFRALVKEEGIEPQAGAPGLIEALDREGFRMALASSAPRLNVELILNQLRLRHFFQAIVSEEDVTRGKPDPQPFLLAAERLGAMPEQSVVIEDAPAGIEAAHRGGMHAVGVTTSHPQKDLFEADLVVDSLADLNPDKILKLLKEK
jgi:tRNA threonylcarbamoyl adenosine modification protein YeaZ